MKTVESKLAAIAAAMLNCEMGLQSIHETYYRIKEILEEPLGPTSDTPPQQEKLDLRPPSG